MKVSPALAEEEVTNYFSGNYQEARIKFVTAAKAAGADLEHYPNPAPGAEGEKLYTDIATFNLPGVKQILVLSSGTHGIEGFAGSAIQTGLLREGITRRLPEDIGLLFIHALNPYGFSHLRRFTEDNVDLNRNFVDHGKPYPPNEGYNKLARVIEPESLSTLGDIQAKLVLTWYRATKGKQWLEVACWVAENMNFDRLYFYSAHSPFHVSYGPEQNRSIVYMEGFIGGRHQPYVMNVEKLRDLKTC